MSYVSRTAVTPLKIIYLSGFIDYAGIAIVYPLFAYLFFEPTLTFFPPETSAALRGMWLGLLLALYPIMQFFSAPLLGALSDVRGRKKTLIASLAIAALGYALALLGIVFQNLWLLILYRLCVGVGAGSSSVLSAMVADLSTPEEKTRHFGFLSMSYGAGFTLGPCLGSLLIQQTNYTFVFLLPLALVLINILLVLFKIRETLFLQISEKWNASFALKSLLLLQRATQFKGLRGLFISLFVFTLGWAFFIEFIPLFLLNYYGFKPHQTGIYYAYAGLFYALSSGLLAPLLVRRFGAEKTLPLMQIGAGLSTALLALITQPILIWAYVPLIQSCIGFVYPTTATLISNRAGKEAQGEAMGIYQAISALGMALCPLFGGVCVGPYPMLVVLVGGGLMFIGGALLLQFQRQRAVESPPSL